jgi:hypothetical protein
MNEATTGREIAPFIETLEYRRFAEFCHACRQYRYIGVCYGPPGVGKTLSARRYASADRLDSLPSLKHVALEEILALGEERTVLYTAPVVNAPGTVEGGIEARRHQLHALRTEPSLREEYAEFAELRRYEEERDRERVEQIWQHDWLSGPRAEPPRTYPTFGEVSRKYEEKRRQIRDPTDLVLIDEADRLKMASLEAVRAIFDRGGIGLVLIGMPGMEKRLARYPQFYSRIGFVHEFRPLGAAEVRRLLLDGWSPPGLCLPPLDQEAVAAVIRITGGNFRLLDRLLSQTERIVRINGLSTVTQQAVEAARESLVIGQS